MAIKRKNNLTQTIKGLDYTIEVERAEIIC